MQTQSIFDRSRTLSPPKQRSARRAELNRRASETTDALEILAIETELAELDATDRAEANAARRAEDERAAEAHAKAEAEAEAQAAETRALLETQKKNVIELIRAAGTLGAAKRRHRETEGAIQRRGTVSSPLRVQLEHRVREAERRALAKDLSEREIEGIAFGSIGSFG